MAKFAIIFVYRHYKKLAVKSLCIIIVTDMMRIYCKFDIENRLTEIELFSWMDVFPNLMTWTLL